MNIAIDINIVKQIYVDKRDHMIPDIIIDLITTEPDHIEAKVSYIRIPKITTNAGTLKHH